MKKKIYLLITLLFIFIPVVKAGTTGISASPSNVTITVGSSQNITVTVTNLAALMDIDSIESSIANVDKAHLDLTSNGPGSTTGTFKITAKKAGSTTITIKTADAADFTNGDDYNQTLTIKVTVNNPPTPAPTPTPQPKPQPSPSQPVTKQPQTQAPRNVDVPTQPVTEPQTEAITEETTTSMRDENSNGIDDEIEFKSLKIVGYSIEFDPKINTYSIDIGSVNALYIISNALTEGATIDNNGEVVIEGLDKIVLTLKYNEKSSNITINLNRTSNTLNKEPSPKTDSKRIKFSTIVIIITGIITFVLVTTGYIYKDELLKLTNSNKKNKKNKKNDENFLDKLKVYDPINFDDKKD